MKTNQLALFMILFSTLSASAQFNYERKQLFNLGDKIESFATADFNKDSKVDLVYSYFNQNYIAYRINETPDPYYNYVSFTANLRIILEKKSSKRELHICDINNDAFEDIIFSEYDNSRIGIAINNTQSQFDDVYYFNSAIKPTRILSGDFNKDLLRDLAVICEGSKQVQVYLGNTTSKLSEPLSYSTLGTPADMELKDVNNDGSTDIMVSDVENNKLQLFTGNGDGTFTKGLTINTSAVPGNFQLDDFDGDQLPDLAVVYKDKSLVQVFYQFENHTFSAPVSANASAPVSELDFVVNDLNSDGYMDMAIRGKNNQKIEILLGESGNQFSNRPCESIMLGSYYTPLGFLMKSIYFTDKLTFLAINSSATEVSINVLKPDFSGWDKFSMVGCAQEYDNMQVADINGDSIKDLILNVSGLKSIELHYGKKDHTYEFIKSIPLTINASELKVFDLNKDGHPEIIATTFTYSEVLWNDGQNNFQSKIIKGFSYDNILVTDVNNNSNPDLLLNSNLYLDVKDGDFSTFTHFDDNSILGTLEMDFNKDGYPDLVSKDINNSLISIYPGRGNGTFEPKINIPGAFEHMTVADINKDGYDDLVASSRALEKVVLFKNDRNGGFEQQIIQDKSHNYIGIFILDLDNDGKEDIVFSGLDLIIYFPIHTDGTIRTKKEYADPFYNNRNVVSADFDHDGNKDLFLLSGTGFTRYSNKIKAEIALKNLVQTYDGLQVDDLVEKTTPEGLSTSMKFNGLVIRPKNAGSYPTQITISDDLYKGTIDTILVVNKAPLTVKAENKVKDYGMANPAFTVNYSGFVNGEAKDFIDLLPKISCLADQNSDAGSYPIVVSGGMDNNYQLNVENGALTIHKIKLTAKAENSSRKYGEQNPLFSISYTGFVNNETASVIDKAPVVSTSATLASAVGSYDLLASAGEDNNYEFDYQKGTLTVEKAPLILKPNAQTRKYGQENPAFSFSCSGFANNESMEVIDQLPVASTIATKLSSVGYYDINLSGGVDNNYQLELQKGHLSIEKAPLTIKAKDNSRTYGEKNPPFTFAFTGLVNNETSEVIDQLPLVSTTATELSSVGSYDILLSEGSDDNYSFELQNGTLNIGKALLTLQADDQYKRRGEENPELTLSAKGFVNNETLEVIDQLPDVSTKAEKDSPAGNYSIDLSGGYDNNYEFSFVSGTMKIDFPLASEGVLSSNIKIYPVPARENVYMENLDEDVRFVRLIDLTGSVIKTMAYNNESRMAISVNGLAPGLYLLETLSGNQKATRYKVMIE